VTFAITLIVNLCKGKSYVNSHQIDKYYTKFTEDIMSGGTIRMFAGDLSFLGKIPEKQYGIDENCIKQLRATDRCDKKVGGFSKKKERRVCKECICKKKQYLQLTRLYEDSKIGKLEILCRTPKKNKNKDRPYKLLLGRLYSIFGDDIEIRFYDDKIKENIRPLGRIKQNAKKETEMYWHWKIAANKYKKEKIWSRANNNDDPAGSTVFYLFNDLLWESFKDGTAKRNGTDSPPNTNEEVKIVCTKIFNEYIR
jgi:hypothetical protein